MYFLLIKNSKPAISNPNLKWLQDQDLTVILLLTNVIFIISIILIVFYERKTVRYYRNQIAQLEDKSRRVLMNPHFFFNALNGIQGLYVTSGIKTTNKYIGKLSKLLRYTLELTAKQFRELIGPPGWVHLITELYYGALKRFIEKKIDAELQSSAQKNNVALTLVNEGEFINEYDFENTAVPFAYRLEKLKRFKG